MLGAFTSEWVKLRRRSMLLWGFGGGLLFTVLATVITIERAQKTFPPGEGHHFHATVAQLSQPDGLVHGVVDVSNLVGIVALSLFAGAVASEYSQGTLRNLLVRQPRRVQLLSGKFLALVLFFGLAVLLAIGVAAGVAFALAPSKGIDTSAWTSTTGLNDLGQSILHVYLAASATAYSARRWRSSCARRRSRSRSASLTRCPERQSSTRCWTTVTGGCRLSC